MKGDVSMNFDFTEEQEILRKTVRGFVDKEIMPHIGEWDAKGNLIQIL